MSRTLLLFVMVITTIICLLFLLILLMRLIDLWKSWSYARRSKSWESLLLYYVSDIISLEEAVKGFGVHYQQMWTFFLPYLRSIRGEEYEKLIELIQKTGLSQYYLHKIRHGSLKARIKAASVMGTLGEKEATNEIQKLLVSKDNEIAAIAAQSLSDMGEVSMLIPVMQRILSQSYTTFEGTTGLTVRFGREACPMIVDLIDRWQAGEVDLQEIFSVPYYQSLSLFIDILGHHQYREESKVYESLLQEGEHPEVLIHLFKALVKMEQQVAVNLRPFLHHEDWVVRSQSAKFVGQIRDRNYMDELMIMLQDEFWWVKFHAGEALLSLGEKELLREIASTEGPGAAMSSYILSKERTSDKEEMVRDDEKRTDVEEEGEEIELKELQGVPLYTKEQQEDYISRDISQELEELEEVLGLFLERIDDLQKEREELSLLETRIGDLHRKIDPFLRFLEEEREDSSSSIDRRVENSINDFKEELLRIRELDIQIEGPGHSVNQVWHVNDRFKDLLIDMALLSFNAIIFSAHLGSRGEPFGIVAHHIKDTSLSFEEKSNSFESLFKGLFPQYSLIDRPLFKITGTFKDMESFVTQIGETSGYSLTSFQEISLDFEPQRERLEKILSLVSILKDKDQESLSILEEERRFSFLYILFIEDSLSLLESTTQMVIDRTDSFLTTVSSFQSNVLQQLQEILAIFPSHLEDELLGWTPIEEWIEELERDGIERQDPPLSTVSVLLNKIDEEIDDLERKILFFNMVRLLAKIELERLGGSIFSTQIQRIVEELQELIVGYKEVFFLLKEEIEEDREAFYGSMDDRDVFSLHSWMVLKSSLEDLKRCKRKTYQDIETFYKEIQEIYQVLRERQNELRQIEIDEIKERLSSLYTHLKEKVQRLHHHLKEYRVEDERVESNDLSEIYRSFAKDLSDLNRDN